MSQPIPAVDRCKAKIHEIDAALRIHKRTCWHCMGRTSGKGDTELCNTGLEMMRSRTFTEKLLRAVQHGTYKDVHA